MNLIKIVQFQFFFNKRINILTLSNERENISLNKNAIFF